MDYDYIGSRPEKWVCICSVSTHSALLSFMSPSMPFTERVRARFGRSGNIDIVASG